MHECIRFHRSLFCGEVESGDYGGEAREVQVVQIAFEGFARAFGWEVFELETGAGGAE